MPVYVDEMFVAKSRNPQAFRVGELTGHRWCHLFAPTVAELHRFAQNIGCKPEWFQNTDGFPHYDLTPQMRLRALRAGALDADLITRRRKGIIGDMTFTERHTEWRYRYLERLGMLAGKDEPSEAQKAIAEQEANQWLDSMVNQ